MVLPSNDSFKYELLYQGYANKTLKITYREFVNDLARAAYYQDASYEITSFPATVTFRTVRVQVFSANNEGLTYKVMSGF